MSDYFDEVMDVRNRAKKSYTEGEFALMDQVRRLAIFFNISTSVGFLILVALSVVPLSEISDGITLDNEAELFIQTVVSGFAAVYAFALQGFVSTLPKRNDFRNHPIRIENGLTTSMNIVLMALPFALQISTKGSGFYQGLHLRSPIFFIFSCFIFAIAIQILFWLIRGRRKRSKLALVRPSRGIMLALLIQIRYNWGNALSVRSTRNKLSQHVKGS